MENNDPQNCWEFMECDLECRKECPAYLYNSGRECWLIAGATSGRRICPRSKTDFDACWKCPWFKKLNPDFDEQFSP